MAKNQETFNKKEKEKKRLKKRKDKEQKMEERKSSQGGGFDSMIAYVDEFGNIVDTPPEVSANTSVDADSIEISTPRKAEEKDEPTERKGKVDYFNSSKGFGFIRDSDNGEKYFVHVNGLIDKVQEEDMVTFELEKGLRGMNAVRVKKVQTEE